MHYIVANRIFVASGFESMFEKRFQNRTGQIDKQPGFVRMQILKPKISGSPYIVLTTWENETVFEDWVKSDDFKVAHQNPMPKDAFDGAGQLEQYEVIIEAEKSG